MESKSIIKVNFSEINFKNATPIYSMSKNRLSINSIDFKNELFLVSSDDNTIVYFFLSQFLFSATWIIYLNGFSISEISSIWLST